MIMATTITTTMTMIMTTTTTTTTTTNRLERRKGCQLLSQMSREILILKRGRSRSRSKSREWCNLSARRAVLNPLVTFHLSSVCLSLVQCRGTWKILVHNGK